MGESLWNNVEKKYVEQALSLKSFIEDTMRKRLCFVWNAGQKVSKSMCKVKINFSEKTNKPK